MDTLKTIALQAPQVLALNYFIFVSFGLTTAVKALVPQDVWTFNWRFVLANTLIICTAFAVTQYWIIIAPKTLYGQVLYVIICLGLSASPIELLQGLQKLGQKIYTSWIRKTGDNTEPTESKK